MFRTTFKILGSSKNLRKVNAGYLGSIQKNAVYQAGILNHAGIRYNSSFATQDGLSLSQEIVQASLAVEPTISSLGLGGMSPKGLLQTGLEMLHVGLDIPWWSAIAIGTICIRIAIFPLVIIAQRNAANMTNHMPTIQALQQKLTAARVSGDPKGVVAAANELTSFMKANKVNPLKSMLPIVAQIPIFLSTFTGIREMASLPVESMKTGGMFWFTDLTVADPMFLLPLMTIASLYATIEVGVDGVKLNNMGNTSMKTLMRIMPLISLPVMINFPSAMLCYWFTSNTFSLVQVSILRIPRIKNYFEIPDTIDQSNAFPLKQVQLPKMSFMESFRLNLKNMEMARDMEERQRLEALKLKESSKEAKEQVDDGTPPKSP